MSSGDKRKLGTALTHLSPDDLSKALEIVAQNNPSFQPSAQEVDLDIDAQVIICFLFVYVVIWQSFELHAAISAILFELIQLIWQCHANSDMSSFHSSIPLHRVSAHYGG